MMNVNRYGKVKGANGNLQLPPRSAFPLLSRLDYAPPSNALPDFNHFATRP